MIALVESLLVSGSGHTSLLAVAAELEFDSISPPPDTIEEVKLIEIEPQQTPKLTS